MCASFQVYALCVWVSIEGREMYWITQIWSYRVCFPLGCAKNPGRSLTFCSAISQALITQMLKIINLKLEKLGTFPLLDVGRWKIQDSGIA